MATTVGPLIQPLLTSLTQATALCAAIKTSRHCGTTHTQLDLLEASLAAGPSFLATASTGLEQHLVDETAQEAFASCNTQLVLICGRLQAIAHPSNTPPRHTPTANAKPHAHSEHKHHVQVHRSHSSSSSSDEKHKEEQEHHHHKRHSSGKPLIFAAFEPLHHHHREVEDPHFGEIRGMWEGVRDGVTMILARVKEEHVEDVKREEVVVEKVEKVEKVEVVKEEGHVVEVKEEKVVEKTEGEREDGHEETGGAHESHSDGHKTDGASEENEERKILEFEVNELQTKAKADG